MELAKIKPDVEDWCRWWGWVGYFSYPEILIPACIISTFFLFLRTPTSIGISHFAEDGCWGVAPPHQTRVWLIFLRTHAED